MRHRQESRKRVVCGRTGSRSFSDGLYRSLSVCSTRTRPVFLSFLPPFVQFVKNVKRGTQDLQNRVLHRRMFPKLEQGKKNMLGGLEKLSCVSQAPQAKD